MEPVRNAGVRQQVSMDFYREDTKAFFYHDTFIYISGQWPRIKSYRKTTRRPNHPTFVLRISSTLTVLPWLGTVVCTMYDGLLFQVDQNKNKDLSLGWYKSSPDVPTMLTRQQIIKRPQGFARMDHVLLTSAQHLQLCFYSFAKRRK